MPDMILLTAEEKMEKSINSFKHELSHLRTGRANPAILDDVKVPYYGVDSPINQIASIQVPEAQQLMVKPYDKSILGDIERAIISANLGFNPSNDGTAIRIFFPALTEERRRDLVKELGKLTEEAKVVVRNIRRDANDHLKKLKNDGDLTEDDLKGYLDDVQELTDKFIDKVVEVSKEKEEAILTI